MKLDPSNTIIGDIASVGKVNVAVWSERGLIGEVLESGEVNIGDVSQVLSVNAKRAIEQWTRGVGPAFDFSFTIWLDGSNKYGNASKYMLMVTHRFHLACLWLCSVAAYSDFLVH